MKEWTEALKRLRQGDYSAWPRHEHIRTGRFDTHDHFESTPTFGLPIWDGREDTTVLVNADCGMGDTICFYRWLPQIKAKEVILRCDIDFEPLFPIPVVSKESPLPGDCVIHMMAVPQILGITQVTGEPYLKPQWEDPVAGLGTTKFTKIGICWAGNPFNPRDKERSIPVEFFNFWGDMKPFSLVKHEPPPSFMLDARGLMSNWNNTAHLINHMDLVISVDTAVAHLAGAMGKPVWMLLPDRATDWRWVGGANWYNSMRIFRRSTTWQALLEEVRAEVTRLFV